ncbi:MAG: hypothetical protein IKO52_06270 [Clostridia bacterium]|nr:hypothetical protein [Clostridia bacterium]
MAYLNEIQVHSRVTDVRQVMEYLRQLEDQVRYALQNLDGENIQAGAIGEEQLSGGVQKRIKTAENAAVDAAATRRTADAATAALADVNQRMAVKLNGSEEFSLWVSGNQPDGHKVIWIKPLSREDDGPWECEITYIP